MCWRRGSSVSPIGIDVGGRTLDAVQLRGTSGAWRILATASIPKRDGTEMPDAADLSRLANVLERQGFVGQDVVLAVPNDTLMSGMIDVPRDGTDKDTLAAAWNELASQHKRDPDTIEAACWAIPAPIRKPDASSVMAVACERNIALDLLDAFDAARFRVRAIDVQSQALVRACGTFRGSATGLSAVLSLDWEAAHLVVSMNGIVIYERILDELGLKPLFQSLGEELSLEGDMIDHLVNEPALQVESADGTSSDELAVTVRDRLRTYLSGLVGEIRRSISYYTQEYVLDHVATFLIAGVGASIPRLGEDLLEELGYEGQVVSPVDLIKKPDRHEGRGARPQLVTAVGLAMYPPEHQI